MKTCVLAIFSRLVRYPFSSLCYGTRILTTVFTEFLPYSESVESSTQPHIIFVSRFITKTPFMLSMLPILSSVQFFRLQYVLCCPSPPATYPTHPTDEYHIAGSSRFYVKGMFYFCWSTTVGLCHV